jgi:hypothetical protein
MTMVTLTLNIIHNIRDNLKHVAALYAVLVPGTFNNNKYDVEFFNIKFLDMLMIIISACHEFLGMYRA